MRILLDECIDWRLTRELTGHQVRTVPQMGWATTKNGKLLELAEKGFDLFVTVDQNLSFQQPLRKFDIAVVILKARSNRLADLKVLTPKLRAIISDLKAGQSYVIEE